jgi:peptidoglycan/LPS O-acetylase OafA/YrhL
MTAIGRASYGIYLWQQLATYPFPGANPGFYVASVIACVGAALVMFSAVERRLIGIGREVSQHLAARITSPRPKVAERAGLP